MCFVCVCFSYKKKKEKKKELFIMANVSYVEKQPTDF